MKCTAHDLEVKGSNFYQVELEALCSSDLVVFKEGKKTETSNNNN